MKIKPVIIGMVAWLLLPLAGANVPAVSDPGLNLAGAGADLEGCAYRRELWAHTDREPGRHEPAAPSSPAMPLQEPEQTALLLGLRK